MKIVSLQFKLLFSCSALLLANFSLAENEGISGKGIVTIPTSTPTNFVLENKAKFPIKGKLLKTSELTDESIFKSQEQRKLEMSVFSGTNLILEEFEKDFAYFVPYIEGNIAIRNVVIGDSVENYYKTYLRQGIEEKLIKLLNQKVIRIDNLITTKKYQEKNEIEANKIYEKLATELNVKYWMDIEFDYDSNGVVFAASVQRAKSKEIVFAKAYSITDIVAQKTLINCWGTVCKAFEKQPTTFEFGLNISWMNLPNIKDNSTLIVPEIRLGEGLGSGFLQVGTSFLYLYNVNNFATKGKVEVSEEDKKYLKESPSSEINNYSMAYGIMPYFQINPIRMNKNNQYFGLGVETGMGFIYGAKYFAILASEKLILYLGDFVSMQTGINYVYPAEIPYTESLFLKANAGIGWNFGLGFHL